MQPLNCPELERGPWLHNSFLSAQSQIQAIVNAWQSPESHVGGGVLVCIPHILLQELATVLFKTRAKRPVTPLTY